jgi:alpha-N-arabinofuranosidase
MKKELFAASACLLFICTSVLADLTVKLDPQKTGAPISKYLYGQFIEHSGHSVYGGLWAEMVVDRKFFYPITDNYDPWGTAEDKFWNSGPFKVLNASPWKVIGPPGTVSMETNHPYVGAQSPAIHLPGNGKLDGVSQDRLGVIKGKKYSGHIVLAGDASAAPVEVRLVLDDGKIVTETIKKLSPDFRSYPLVFTAPAFCDNVRLEIVSRGKGEFRIGLLTLMPADNLDGWRKDVVDLLKQLNSPIYRWPGGNFVSGYNWRDGIGKNRDLRAPMKNPAWWGVEPNDVGIDEFMDLMHIIGADAYIALNTGLGTVQEAADEVQYLNGSVDTPMGKLRAENGHPEPYNVKYFAVGNEMWGSWQLGHMPVDRYIHTNNLFAAAIWKADPQARLVAVGQVGNWTKAMLENCSDGMNFMSEHIYVKEKTNLLAHVQEMSPGIADIAKAYRQYDQEIPGLAAKNIRVVLDEWNYWYGPYLYGELGVRYHFKDALGIAEGLHELFRNSDLFFMANYAQTINVLGCIKVTSTAADMATTALPLELYHRHFGTIPITVSGSTGNLDVAAAWTDDKEAITIAIVNPAPQDQQVKVDFGGLAVKGKAERWLIGSADPESYNEPGQPPNVTIKREKVDIENSTLLAPHYSISLYRLDVH